MVARNTYVKTSAGWEQIATTIQAVPQGLVPIVPTSVAGTGVSFTGDGVVSFSGSGTVSLNGVFTSAYANYKIIFKATGTATPLAYTMKLRANGTDTATSNYNRSAYISYAINTGSGNYNSAADAGFLVGYSTTAFGTSSVMELLNPAVADYTRASWSLTGYDANHFGITANGLHATASAYDGFSITLSSGAQTGTIQVYGYSKGSLTQPQTIQPYSQAAGTVAASATNGSTTSPLFWDAGVTVTFPVGRFTVAPVVTASARLATAVVWSNVDSVSSTSFTVRAVRVGSYPGAGTTHSWQATQMTSASAGG